MATTDVLRADLLEGIGGDGHTDVKGIVSVAHGENRSDPAESVTPRHRTGMCNDVGSINNSARDRHESRLGTRWLVFPQSRLVAPRGRYGSPMMIKTVGAVGLAAAAFGLMGAGATAEGEGEWEVIKPATDDAVAEIDWEGFPEPEKEVSLLYSRALTLLDDHTEDLGRPYTEGDMVVIPVATPLGRELVEAEFGTNPAVRIDAVDVSFAELDDQAVDVLREMGDEIGGSATATADSEHETVIVSVPDVTLDVREALAEEFGAEELVVAEDPSLSDADVATRLVDMSPFAGGLDTAFGYPNGYKPCTGGFPWTKNAAGTDPFMVTAGHCGERKDPYDYDVNAGESMGTAHGTRSNFDIGIGTVKYPGQNEYNGDLTLINVMNNKAVSDMIWVSNSGRIPVTGWRSNAPVEGHIFCISGVMSQQECPFEVREVFTNYETQDGDIVRHIVRTRMTGGYCPVDGDSGAPVYFRDNNEATAAGIVSGGGGGGGDGYGGALDPCSMLFTWIGDAYDSFDGRLKLRLN